MASRWSNCMVELKQLSDDDILYLYGINLFYAYYIVYVDKMICYVHKCELSDLCPGHNIKLHSHRVPSKIISNRVWVIMLGIDEGAHVIISK